MVYTIHNNTFTIVGFLLFFEKLSSFSLLLFRNLFTTNFYLQRFHFYSYFLKTQTKIVISWFKLKKMYDKSWTLKLLMFCFNVAIKTVTTPIKTKRLKK